MAGKSMKVALLTQQYGTTWSGVGTYSYELANALKSEGHEVMVMEPGKGLDVRQGGITVRKVGSWGIDRALNYWLPVSWRFKSAVRKVVADFNPHIIHFTDAREALFTRLKGVVVVGTMNDCYAAVSEVQPLKMKPDYSDWIKRYAYYRLQTSLEPFALKSLTRVISNSEYVKQVIVEKYGIPSERVDVVYYGIRPEAGRNAGEKVRLDGEPSILFVGSNWERKGLNALINALGMLKKIAPKAVLHIVGDDPKRPIMENKASSLGVLENITFHGRKDNEAVRGMEADVLVMPSLVEAFGIVYLEAMADGIPAIGTTNGGTVELIEDGVNGYTVDPGDAATLADRIASLWKDSALREKIVKEGRKTAAKYTVENMASQTMEIYRKALSEG